MAKEEKRKDIGLIGVAIVPVNPVIDKEVIKKDIQEFNGSSLCGFLPNQIQVHAAFCANMVYGGFEPIDLEVNSTEKLKLLEANLEARKEYKRVKKLTSGERE